MKKKVKLWHVVLGVMVTLAVIAYWQRNNIQAVKDFATYTQEELEEQLQKNDQVIKDTVNTLPEIVVREATEEEKQALRDGTMTQEELADRLLDTTAEDTVEPVPKAPDMQDEPVAVPIPTVPDVQDESVAAPVIPEQSKGEQPVVQQPETKPEKSEYEQKLSELVAEVYVLREEYLIALDNLQAEAIEAYKASPSDERKPSKLTDFVSSFLAKGTALEKDCDKKMDLIVAEMRTLIKENNGDLSLLDTVVSTYANEKSLKKAWYMSELEKRGFI